MLEVTITLNPSVFYLLAVIKRLQCILEDGGRRLIGNVDNFYCNILCISQKTLILLSAEFTLFSYLPAHMSVPSTLRAPACVSTKSLVLARLHYNGATIDE
jgi:hypothetical protein